MTVGARHDERGPAQVTFERGGYGGGRGPTGGWRGGHGLILCGRFFLGRLGRQLGLNVGL